jgi:CspA family cold shock protein
MPLFGAITDSRRFVPVTKDEDPTHGTVRWFDGEQGWGVIDSPEVPGGCFVHFSNIVGDGYRKLDEGQKVVFTYEQPGFKQDGYDFRAFQVWSA